MAELYLGRWEWFTDVDGASHWRGPGGDHIGCLDLRSNVDCGLPGPASQGWGLFVYSGPKVHANLIVSLGSNLNRNLSATEKSAWRTAFNVPASTTVSNRLRDAIRQCSLDSSYVDATGQARWKPIRGSLGNRIELKIGGLGTLYSEVFDSSHPAFANTIATFRADYLRNREVALIDPQILRKWTGATMLKLFGAMSDLNAQSILPSQYAGDGWLSPTTSISDTFTDTDLTSLDAHTSDSGGTWNEVVGDWEIFSNEARIVAAALAFARQTTNLSSDDHKCSVDVTAQGATTRTGPSARFSTDAAPNDDHYNAQLSELATDNLRFQKHVDGVETGLDFNRTVTISLPDNVEIEVNNSTMISRFNAVTEHNFTDTSLTGQLQCGMRLRRTADRIDNFSAQDLAAGATHPGWFGKAGWF